MIMASIKDALNFKGKTAVITGGNKGLGVTIARRFAEAGANVVITYFSEEMKEDAERFAGTLENGENKALALKLDVRSREEIKAMVKAVEERLGTIDYLINNAGIYPHREFFEVDEAFWDAMMDANLKGAFFCTQEAARLMKKHQNGGAVVNIVSINAYRHLPDATVYCISKAGTDMMTKCLAVELAPYNIRVNGVAPGLLDDPNLDKNAPGWREAYERRAPLGRLVQPQDIADVCLFYCSELSSFVTGEVTAVDGGVLQAKAY